MSKTPWEPYLPPDRRKQTHDASIVRMETRRLTELPSQGIHGFALLTFRGSALQIEYVDEEGGTSWSEDWG